MQTITIKTALITNFRDSSGMMFDPSFGEMMLMDRTQGPDVTIAVDETQDEAATIAEKVWVVGNRMARDANGTAWPSNVRSMSMGDAVVFEYWGETFIAIAKDFGFHVEFINPLFVDKVAAPRSEQGEFGPWADASDEVVAGLTERESAVEFETARIQSDPYGLMR